MTKQMLNSDWHHPSIFFNMNFNLFQCILDYLNTEQLCSLLKSIQCNRKMKVHSRFIKIKYTYDKYYNRSDKSYFFMVFQNNLYLQHETASFKSKARNQSQTFNKFQLFPHQYTNIMNQVQQSIQQDLRSELIHEIQLIFFDPCIPMPKLLRQTVSSISSPLQNFLLSSIDYENSSVSTKQRVFQELKQKLDQGQETYLVQMMNNHPLANELVNNGYAITYENRANKMIKGNKLHNTLVSIFALTDIQLDLVSQYLKEIVDPFELFLHLNTKYQQFMSTIISIQENLGSLFKSYSCLYNEVFGKSISFSFWKHGLAKWINKMGQFHEITHQVCSNVAQSNWFQKNKQLLNNSLAYYSFKEIHKKQSFTYSIMKLYSNQLNILIHNYQDYLVDLSINESNIVYCGHSDQQIDEPYLQFERLLVKEEVKLIEQLKNKSHIGLQNELILQDRLEQLEQILKPRTLRSILKEYEAIKLSPHIMKKLIAKDKEIEKYVSQRNKAQAEIDLFTPYMIAIGFGYKSDPETSDSQNALDYSFEFYESVIDQEQMNQRNGNYFIEKQSHLSQTK